jgi:hypothetical protein
MDSTAAVQQTLSLKVVGINPPPVANPSNLTFAYTPLGAVSAPQSITVTSFNNDPISVQVVDGQFLPFFLPQGNSCSTTPCQIAVAFAPTAANTGSGAGGNSFGNVLITDLFSGQGAVVNTMGAFLPPPPQPPTTLTIDSHSLTFDPQTVGSASPGQTLTLTNTGNQTLYVTISVTGANPGDYVLSNPCTQMAAVGQGFNTCTFFVQFSPTATGTRTANVQVISNTPSSPDLVSLTGTGQ